jgi:cytochrome c oxidase cbb3-type subunit 3
LRTAIACLLLLAAHGAGAQGIGPNFPAHTRAAGDPAVVERGKTLYGAMCRACHGGDLRGGDIGGPNLLRSQLVLNDQAGELIGPVIREGRVPVGGGQPMPPQPQLAQADLDALSEYIHAVARTTVAQGGPPRGEAVELNLLVGNARAGESYFKKECTSCHSTTGDLAGIASKMTNIGQLQDSWVNGRRAVAAIPNAAPVFGAQPAVAPTDASRRIVRVTVKFTDGTQATGALGRIDDFIVSLTDDTGQYRSYTRRAGTPRIASVQVNDPLQQHRVLWTKLTDKDMHDVTAYLATLK